MRREIRILAWCLVSFLLVAWPAVMAQEQPDVAESPTVISVYRSVIDNRFQAARTKIQKALDEPTNLEFVETPLIDVVDYLKDLHGIEIQLDNKALNDSGRSDDTPVTKNLRGISLDAALQLMLGPMELVYLIEDEVLLITTRERAARSVSLRAYDCRWAEDGIPRLPEVLALTKPIGVPNDKESLAAAEQFKVEVSGSAIVVCASALQHDAIERLLIDLRRINALQNADPKASQPPAAKQPAAQDK